MMNEMADGMKIQIVKMGFQFVLPPSSFNLSHSSFIPCSSFDFA